MESSIANLYKKLSITPFLFNMWASFKEYAYSLYQNSIGQLIFFVLAFSTYFWARHIRISKQIKSIEQRSPFQSVAGAPGVNQELNA